MISPSDKAAFFYVGETRREEPVLELDWNMLSDPEAMRRFLDTYRDIIGAPTPDVAATYFASLLGSLCAGFHYSLVLERTELRFGEGADVLQLFGGGAPLPMLAAVSDRSRRPIPENEDSNAERDRLERFYGETIRPILESASRESGERVRNLWLLLVSRLVALEDRLVGMADPEPANRLKSHFTLLREEVPPGVFGLKNNPFAFEFRMVEDPEHPGRSYRQRAACCLAYKIGEYGYCLTCPRVAPKMGEAAYSPNPKSASGSA
ncbi:(2Fe-2S)-binding protein [Cohnella caldifontis]|uniref:(2Fe-2S)-binding protein n=1 Tax=Cohnella caldifontis TaxID=3027471 RepID=UPI0023ED7E3E|nr:(2Fe-2S)-binding protein [Cohnella sp. YIM B05605]